MSPPRGTGSTGAATPGPPGTAAPASQPETAAAPASTAVRLLPAGYRPGSPVPSPAPAARPQGPGARSHCPIGLSVPWSGHLWRSAPPAVLPGCHGGQPPGIRRSPADTPRRTMPAALSRSHPYKKCRWPGAACCRSGDSAPGHPPPARRTGQTAAASTAADTVLLQKPPGPSGRPPPAWRAMMPESRIPEGTPPRHRRRPGWPPTHTAFAAAARPLAGP